MTTSSDSFTFQRSREVRDIPRPESPLLAKYKGSEPPGTYVSRAGVVTTIPTYSGTNPPVEAPTKQPITHPSAEWITEKLESSFKPPIGDLGVGEHKPHRPFLNP